MNVQMFSPGKDIQTPHSRRSDAHALSRAQKWTYSIELHACRATSLPAISTASLLSKEKTGGAGEGEESHLLVG